MPPTLYPDRFRGALLGLALGDATGTTVEFAPRGSFEPVTDLVGGGPFNLPAGKWTDDTSMALCLADSLLEKQGFDPAHQMDLYLDWYRRGYRSSTGTCFDIGLTVSSALHRFEDRPEEPFAGSTDPQTAGNGSLMRLAPVPMYYARDPEQAIRYSGDSSRTTHGARAAIDACRYYGGLLVAALHGAPKDELLQPLFRPGGAPWPSGALHDTVETVAKGSFHHKSEAEITGSGYVVHSLEAALWAFANSHDFETGCLLAVNLGLDADTTAAIYGQLAGAFYGASGLPGHWLDRLYQGEAISRLADRLYQEGPQP